MNELLETITKPREIALYKSLDMAGFFWVAEVSYVDYDESYQTLPNGQRREMPKKNYVRVSEPLRIVFTALSDNSMVQKAIESLDEAERHAIAELNAKIAGIRAQKAQLLALTHQSESVSE